MFRLNEVQEYSLVKDSWTLHSHVPAAVSGSSAVVLDDVMYNLGGFGASHSIMWCDLNFSFAPNWNFMDLPNHSFKRSSLREAFVLENKIVYFGPHEQNRTFVLEKEGDSEQLKVVREDKGFGLKRGAFNTASCSLNNEIYAFETGNFENIYLYSLESGEWSLCYPE